MNLPTRFRLPWHATRLWVRLAFGFGFLLLLMLLVVVLAVQQFRSLAAQNEEMMQRDMQRMLQVQQLRQAAQEHGLGMARLLLAPAHARAPIYQVVNEEYATIGRLLQQLTSRVADVEDARLIAELAVRGDRYRSLYAGVVAQLENGQTVAARAAFDMSVQSAAASLLAASESLIVRDQAVLAKRQRRTAEEIRRSEWLLLALSTAAVALGILLAWGTAASVAGPLARIESAARRIARGDYTSEVHVRGGDELGKVALAMNSMASAIATREAEIERLAYVDRLSGLPNRARLLRLAHNAKPDSMSVILMDVARLRTVNEVLGFEVGDWLLVQLTERLRTAAVTGVPDGTRPLLARLAGDLFALLCFDLDRARLERLRAHVDHAATAPLQHKGHAVDVSLVFGLADSGGKAQTTIEGLLLRAEQAVAEAKRAKQTWAWHVGGDDAGQARQLSLLSSLRGAVSAGELELWLQPKQCLRSGLTKCMEGLVRWRHPVRGYVSPAEFIPFAERTGHIGVVTDAMIDAALQVLTRWRSLHPDLSIAVNVSTLDIQDPTFVRRVERAARRYDAPLDRLTLEITEGTVMDNADQALAVLEQLRALGVRLSIDDFGTGYSSLAYFKRLPVSELKIDRSFVANADQQPVAKALLRTIIDLGHSFSMEVTAEGVERVQERDLLVELGCDQIQGHLFSWPLDPQAAARFLAAMPVARALA